MPYIHYYDASLSMECTPCSISDEFLDDIVNRISPAFGPDFREIEIKQIVLSAHKADLELIIKLQCLKPAYLVKADLENIGMKNVTVYEAGNQL